MRLLLVLVAHVALLVLLVFFVAWLQWIADKLVSLHQYDASLSASLIKAGSMMLLAAGCYGIVHLLSTTLKRL